MKYLTKTLSLLMVIGMCCALYITASTHEAPELYPNNGGAESVWVKEQRKNLPKNVPTWEKSDRKFGCTKEQTEEIHGTVLVVDQKNDRVLMSFDEADRVAHNENRADDVWVVGFC